MTSIFGTNTSKNRWKVLSINNDLNSVKFLKEALTQKKYPVVAGSSLSFTWEDELINFASKTNDILTLHTPFCKVYFYTKFSF